MDAALRELNGQIDLATQGLLDDARTLAEADLRVPSLLPGWTRAHVIAHVARGADAMRNLLAGARSGHDRPAYASARTREADIERGAAMSAADLMADLADSAMALRAVVRQLPDEAWHVPVRVLDSAPFPAAGVLTRRLAEVELRQDPAQRPDPAVSLPPSGLYSPARLDADLARRRHDRGPQPAR